MSSMESLVEEAKSDAAAKRFVIGVAGGPSSGKSSVCDIIVSQLDEQTKKNVCIIRQECFYKPLSEHNQVVAGLGGYNFDHPDAVDWKKMENVLLALIGGNPVKIPVYDMKSRNIVDDEMESVPAVNIILVEGTLILFSKRIRQLLDIKLFVDVDSDVRLSRRVVRDTELYGRPLNQVLAEYVQFVKPSFEDFILPTKKRADIILPRGAENVIAVNVIVQQIQDWLAGKSDLKLPKTNIVSDMLHSSLPSPDDQQPYQAIMS